MPRRIALLGVSLFFAAAGVSHFTNTEFFVSIMPPYLPAHLEFVYLTGVCELLGSVGVLPVRTRRLAGYGLVALLFAVFPANVHMAMNPDEFVANGTPLWALYLRLPLQFVLVLWVWWSTRPRGAKLVASTALVLAAAGCTAAPVTPVDAVAAAEAKLGIQLESQRIETNGIELHVVMAGPAEGPAVLLLHGMPEFWWGWHRQIAALAAAGFRVVVPDLRGINASDKPREVAAYRVGEIGADVLGLMDALGRERVFLAGHDSGAGVAWYLTIEHPERVRRLAVFGIGHPFAFREMVAGGEVPFFSRVFYGAGAMLLRSGLLEELLRVGNWAPLTIFLRASSAGNAFPQHELDYYRYAWARDNAIETTLNWYRADLEYGSQQQYVRDGRVELPVLIILSGRDLTVPQEPGRKSVRFCTNARVEEVDDASHWILHEKPDLTSRILVEFFGS